MSADPAETMPPVPGPKRHAKHRIWADGRGRWRVESPGYASMGWSRTWATDIAVAQVREDTLSSLRSYERGEQWEI